ncbi:MAG: glyoxalase [Verrucomicrobia bacterium]|nr:MAG: glyoxalase [Verrucomicrobiota bacterium]
MNGSVLIPSLRYKNAPAAIAWLEQAFGFECHAVYEGPDGTVAHAELRFGNGMVMVGSASNKSPLKHLYVSPVEIGGRVTSPLYLIVEDCEPAYARALAAKAEIVMDMKIMEYGGKAFTVQDPEGYLWSLGEYSPWTEKETVIT